MLLTRYVSHILLWLGDALAFLLVTVIGFASHGTLESSAALRFLATLVPFYSAWVIVVVFGGLGYPGRVRGAWLLRSTLASILAAPLGATLRGFLLGAPILPVFAAVMAGVSAVVLVAWRGLYIYVLHPRLPAR